MIEAKIAQILTPFTAAITAGSAAGVEIGDQVQVVRLVPILDPDTNEDLGSVPIPIVLMTVEVVREKVSVVRVSSTYTVASSKFLKRLTDDEDLSDYKTAVVAPGYAVEISPGTPF
jgi:hypothetical protein